MVFVVAWIPEALDQSSCMGQENFGWVCKETSMFESTATYTITRYHNGATPFFGIFCKIKDIAKTDKIITK